VLTGPSGVGKSSLLNALEPGLGLRMAPISEAVGKGTHTTVSSRS
jgi:ribosome biogenesis GTPase / thiamine phosphate phosphatase